MITLDTVRTALTSEQPWTELDRLVRIEQEQGRRVKDIQNELDALVEPIRDALGLTDDADDALMDTLDALAGNCAPHWRYTDPPTLPTEEEIAKLPRWARVAFAARCARRVMIAYVYSWPEGKAQFQIEQRTLAECEDSSQSGEVRVGRTRVSYGTIFAGMPRVAETVARVVGEVFFLTVAQGNDVPGVGRFLQGLRDGFGDVFDLQPLIRRDFDHLAGLARWQHWTDDTPVPPEVFGPLWPEGPPEGWPADPDVPQRTDLPLEILSRARVLDQMTEDGTVNLFNAINAYYIARTGIRLTLEDLRPLIAAGVPVEV